MPENRKKSKKFLKKEDWGRFTVWTFARITPQMKQKIQKEPITESGVVRAALERYFNPKE